MTPFERIRYPWASDVVTAADLQSMGADIDQQLVQASNLSADFSKFAVVQARRSAAQSLTKGTLTAITFDNVVDNGASSPLSNGAWWSAGTPTRLTAPTACIVLAVGMGGVNATSAWGSPAALQVTVAKNGASATPNVQGSKYSPTSTTIGQQWASAMSMWSLVAGDYLELKMFWTGTPAGPFNTDTAVPPFLYLMMVALPSVP
jgi:hypothetical protein